MTPRLLLPALIVLAAGACNASEEPRASQPSTAPSAENSVQATREPPSREVDIYSAVIRQLGSERDLARRAEVVYVVDGEVTGAGKPRGDPFGPPSRSFPGDVAARIREQVADDLPPLRFVDDGTEAVRNPERPGPVKNGGVLISLGPIRSSSARRVLVPNTLWCGGKCSQWQTYVLSRRGGLWRVTGTSGSVVGS